MAGLSDLLAATQVIDVRGETGVEITGLSIDSRTVKPGDLFVALRGGQLEDRHAFIGAALDAGATALVVEDDVEAVVPVIRVKSTQNALADLASRFYDHPHRSLRMVGVTGTNGKTTTTYLLRAMLEAHGLSTGLIGTIEYRIGNRCVVSDNTTPEANRLQALLQEMVVGQNQAAVMEVSSHALSLGRVRGIDFEQAIFTNLTRDHLDYHSTYEAYTAAKATLFDNLDPDANAIVNADDDTSVRMLAKCKASVLTYGTSDQAGVRIVGGESHFRGSTVALETPEGPITLSLALTGAFNRYNAAAAVAAGLRMGVDLGVIAESLKDVTVPGRFELVDEGQPFGVFVDYAHTTDGLDNALRAGRALTDKRLISVFGCGGDRDPGKRPEMGRVSATLADVSVVTSDNPRSEDPEAIVRDILSGVGDTPHRVEVDRRTAIELAIGMAKPGDLIVIAGKGHEDYQIIGSETIHFDDREEAARALRARLGN